MDEALNNQKKSDDNFQPLNPVGSANKEGGRYIESSEAEPNLAGVEEYVKPSEQPVPEHVDIGLRPSAESVKAQTEPKGTVVLPMTGNEVKQTLKEGLGAEVDVHNHFEGINFGRSKYFLAKLVEKLNLKSLMRQVN